MLNPKVAFLSVLISTFIIACADPGAGNKEDDKNFPSAANDTSKKSIPMESRKVINGTQLTIKYHSPGVRGRVIWGGLVPYGEVWVTGAHNATTLEVSRDFIVGGRKIPAGKYALFTIPGKEEWTVIINRNWQQHLADEYAEKDDLARVPVKPRSLSGNVERLKYEIDQTGERMADIIISWEKVSIPFAIRID